MSIWRLFYLFIIFHKHQITANQIIQFTFFEDFPPIKEPKCIKCSWTSLENTTLTSTHLKTSIHTRIVEKWHDKNKSFISSLSLEHITHEVSMLESIIPLHDVSLVWINGMLLIYCIRISNTLFVKINFTKLNLCKIIWDTNPVQSLNGMLGFLCSWMTISKLFQQTFPTAWAL